MFTLLAGLPLLTRRTKGSQIDRLNTYFEIFLIDHKSPLHHERRLLGTMLWSRVIHSKSCQAPNKKIPNPISHIRLRISSALCHTLELLQNKAPLISPALFSFEIGSSC